MTKELAEGHLRALSVKLRGDFELFDEMMREGGVLTAGSQASDRTLILRGRLGDETPVVVKVMVTQMWSMGTSGEDGEEEPHCVTADRLACTEEIGPPIRFTEWRVGQRTTTRGRSVSFLYYCLCMEDFGLGDLYDHLWAKLNRHPRIGARLLAEMARQVRRFYDLGWHHGDLKLENAVVEDAVAGRVRLIDFNTARPIGTKPAREAPCDPRWCFPSTCAITGTPAFIPPEKTALKYRSTGCDHRLPDLEKESVFSLGVVLLELVTAWPKTWHRRQTPEKFPSREGFEILRPHLPAEHPFFRNDGVDRPGFYAHEAGWTWRRDRLLAQRLADLCVEAGDPAPARRPTLGQFIARLDRALEEHKRLTADNVRLFWNPCPCPDGHTRGDPLRELFRRPAPPGSAVRRRVSGHRRGYPLPIAKGRSVSENAAIVAWVPTSIK